MLKLIELRDTFGALPERRTVVRILVFCSAFSETEPPADPPAWFCAEDFEEAAPDFSSVADFDAGAGLSLVLDLAAGTLQRKYPVEAMSTYLNGFHFYADDAGRQVEASHFCIHLRHDLHQCVIFDSNRHDARLIGIEYISFEEYQKENGGD